MNRQNDNNWPIGAIFGIGLLAGVALLILMPGYFMQKKRLNSKSDKLKRMFNLDDEEDRIKDIFGDSTETTRSTYYSVKNDLLKKLASLRSSIEDINKQKYLNTLKEVVWELRNQGKLSTDQLEKLQSYLAADYEILKRQIRRD